MDNIKKMMTHDDNYEKLNKYRQLIKTLTKMYTTRNYEQYEHKYKLRQ